MLVLPDFLKTCHHFLVLICSNCFCISCEEILQYEEANVIRYSSFCVHFDKYCCSWKVLFFLGLLILFLCLLLINFLFFLENKQLIMYCCYQTCFVLVSDCLKMDIVF